MTDRDFVQVDPDVKMYLKRFATGVTVILWLVLSSMLLWPIASVIAAYGDQDITDTSILTIATILAGIASYVVCRLVFPIEYGTDAKKQPEE